MNILIVAIDSFRADRLPHPRRPAPTAPHLQKLAARGTVFAQAVTGCVLTTPSFVSLLTGRFIPSHGVHSLRGCRLSRECPTLVESFREEGYYTFAEVTGPLLECVGLNRGFVSYRCRDKKEFLATTWGERLLKDFEHRAFPEPWFGLLHLWETHSPYYVPAPYDSSTYGHTPYDRSIAGLDLQLGYLVDALPKDTLLVVLGDHGETLTLEMDLRLPARLIKPLHERIGWLWEQRVLREYTSVYVPGDQRLKSRLCRGLARLLAGIQRTPSRSQFYRRWFGGHGEQLYDEVVRVPLMFIGKPFPAKVVTPQVRTIDVLPTLLDVAGLSFPDSHGTIDGRSLLPLVRGEENGDRVAYFETGGGNLPDRKLWLRGIRTPAYKFTYTPNAPKHHYLEELYDLQRDPGETRNIIRNALDVVAQMRAECEAIAAPPLVMQPVAETLSADEEAVLTDRLRQLGYLE